VVPFCASLSINEIDVVFSSCAYAYVYGDIAVGVVAIIIALTFFGVAVVMGVGGANSIFEDFVFASTFAFAVGCFNRAFIVVCPGITALVVGLF
jgi:hypothetical protein